ncbi:MAG: hypothetical protein GC202_02140 [Alphaproteobacteria bacterium]|nr:hypothetical protein [Alphaproteobacteria bacterium]
MTVPVPSDSLILKMTWADIMPRGHASLPADVWRALAEAAAVLDRARQIDEMRAQAFESRVLFGLAPPARALRVLEDGWRFGLALDGLTERAVRYHADAVGDAKVGDWIDKFLGGPAWRSAGCGIARARLKADGSWDDWELRDLAPEGSRADSDLGAVVVTVPVYDAFEVVEIFAIELAPGIGARRVGRVFGLTGDAYGLGTASVAFAEWRRWSSGVTLVASPIEWIRAHCLHEATRIVAPLVDGMPTVWLAGLDEADGYVPDARQCRERDRFLLESDPLICVGAELAVLVDKRLDAARRAALPKRGDVLVWTAEEKSKTEAAA